MAKIDTLSSLWKELEGKHMDDIDVDDYVDRFRKIRTSKKKNKKNDRSAKIVSAKKTDNIDNAGVDNTVSIDNKVVEKESGIVAGIDEAELKVLKENKKQQENKNSDTKAVNGAKSKKRDTSRDELATKIGAGVFFGVFGVVQLWLLIDWIAKGCLLDVLVLHLLPIIIVVALFTVTFIIDIINKRRSKREAAKKAKVVNKLNRSSKKERWK